MIIRKQEFNLEDKTILGRLQFKPPFKGSQPMFEEARLVYVVKGTTRLIAPSMQQTFTTGDAFIMRCDNFISSWQPNEDSSDNEIIIFQIYPKILKLVYNNQLPESLKSKGEKQLNPVEKINPSGMLDNFIESLRNYLDNPKIIDSNLLKLKTQELIHVLTSDASNSAVRAILGDLFKTQDHEFKIVIHANIFEDLSTEELAFLTGMSLSTFKRKFKSVYDTSPNKYIHGKRLEKAAQLLETTSLRISEIAYDCGFNDTGYFTKSFTSQYNIAPSAYRSTMVQ